MVLHGYYKEGISRVPGPFLMVYVSITRLGAQYVSITRLGAQGFVEFLVDSGANGVYIHQGDAQNLAIPPGSLRQNTLEESFGLAGREWYYSETGLLSFGEDFRLRHQLKMFIAREDSNTPAGVPSLLGRDFLNLCDIRLDHATNTVSLTPRNVNEHGEIPAA